MCALDQIANNSDELRAVVIECGIVEPLLALVRNDSPNTFLRRVAFMLSMLCKGKDQAVLLHFLPMLSSLLGCDHERVLMFTCLALRSTIDYGLSDVYISVPNEITEAVIKTG